MACLSSVGIENRAQALARSLSYGERRRLEIARAMALRPRLLLLDEPIAGMRHQEIEEMGNLFRSLVGGGVTILLIEHNMPFIMRHCSRITVLHFGQTVTTGTPEEVAGHREVIEAYLGRKSELISIRNRDVATALWCPPFCLQVRIGNCSVSHKVKFFHVPGVSGWALC